MKRAGMRIVASILALVCAIPARAAPPPLELIASTAIPQGSRFRGIEIGGLSGLDRLPDGDYLAISDDKGDGRPPRFYRLAIRIDAPRHRMQVRVRGQVVLRDAQGVPFPTDRKLVDPEAIRHIGHGHVLWSSEGTWQADPVLRTQPAIHEADAHGRILHSFALPATYRYADNRTRGAESNGVIEGLAVAPDGDVFAINELPAFEDRPITADTPAPALHRLTRFDPTTRRPIAQYLYGIPDAGYGVSELLAIDDHRFLTIERASSFDMAQGVHVRIVLSTITPRTGDVLACPALPRCEAVPVTRRVLLDLPGRYRRVPIDNLEGLAWGPRLRDGRRTLIAMADDNFSRAEQSQFLAFAWTDPERSPGPSGRRALQQLVPVETQQVHGFPNARPVRGHERRPFRHAQPLRRAGQHEHADATPYLDIAIVLKALISLSDGQRIGAVFGGEGADRGKLVARAIVATQYARRDRAAEAEIDRAVLAAKCCHGDLIHHGTRLSTHQCETIAPRSGRGRSSSGRDGVPMKTKPTIRSGAAPKPSRTASDMLGQPVSQPAA